MRRSLMLIVIGMVVMLAGVGAAEACPLSMSTDGTWEASGEIVMMGYDRVRHTPIVLFELGPDERCLIDIAGFDGYKFPKAPVRVMLSGVVLGLEKAQPSCRVVGRVYGGRDEPDFDLERTQPVGCMAAELSDDGGLVWITHPEEPAKHATIPVPTMPGWQRIDYVWGSTIARVNGREVPVRRDPPEAWMPHYYLTQWSVLVAS